MGRVDTVVFDFFGVIFQDPLKTWKEQHSLQDEPAVAQIARLLDTGAISYDEYVDRLAALSSEPVSGLYQQFQSTTLLNQPVVDTIAHLGNTHRVGLLSNTCTEEITPLLDQNDLAPLFNEVVISSETGFAKPDPAIYELALGRLAAQPGRTIFIDDSLTNIKSAAGLGIHTIHFQNVEQLHDELGGYGISFDMAGAAA